MPCFALLILVVAAATGFDPLDTDHLPATSTAQSTMRTLESQTQITRFPCTCNAQSESCSCCGRVDQTSTNFHARGCGIVRYGRSRNRSLRYEVTVNNRTVGRTEAAATKSPMELCVPAAFLTICTKFFNVEYQNATFTFCFRFDVKYSKFTLLAVEFDCVRAAIAPGINARDNSIETLSEASSKSPRLWDD